MDKTKRAVLFQLEPDLAQPLQAALTAEPLRVNTHTCDDLAQLADFQAHWIFTANLTALDQAVELATASHAKVVVVSRLADTRTYLDAMDRGAHDYCSAPFDRAHLQWVLQHHDRAE
ncbi:MAG: hypothetical protein JNK87_14370 [Bryobacterales bacterium]|nr:hypothetical protein [Bryobacterales bacterium]